MHVRALKTALNANGRFKYKSPEYVVDHLVVGAGVVGLAVAQRLAHKFPEKTTYLVERHLRAGEETSSRNSEVIHAGIYYPPDSLKTQLCLRGRQLLYDRCTKYNIPYRKTGKLVVAHPHQRQYVENLHAKAQKLQWPLHSDSSNEKPVAPTNLISGDEARQLEPNLSKDIDVALWSPETGIVDSHSFMESLEKEIQDSENGELAYSTAVVRVDPYESSSGSGELEGTKDGWVVQTVTGNATSDDGDALLARTLINASGLSGQMILNALLPLDERLPMYYARGSYASYSGPGIGHVSHLIYPCPDDKSHAFASLGTHLTIDLQGKVRFGPDLEWISPPWPGHNTHGEETAVDFWQRHLVPDESRLKSMHEAVTHYLPDVQFEGMQPDYVGIRPKLVPPNSGFQDFTFRVDHPNTFHKSGSKTSSQTNPMISLLGIESPGLTASLAIAEKVVDDILGETNMRIRDGSG